MSPALWVLLTSLPWSLGWLVAAAGLGRPLRAWLLRDRGVDGVVAQVALGVAAMLALDAALGALGALQWAGGAGAWLLIVVGIGLVIDQLRRSGRPAVALPWAAWLAAPAVAVMLVAACSAPGWLWASEFGGYDALSYHLQLPKEWHALGRITGLEHNVYSFLPGYVEAAYYHLAVLIGDGIGAVYACQLLHAGLALLAAVAVGRLAARVGDAFTGAVAAAIMLGTPWTVVVGSLAYNEMAVTLFLAAGLLVLDGTPPTPGRGAAVGLLAGAACGAKLTAVGFAAVPLGLLLLLSSPARRWPAIAGAGAAAGLACLLPWLARNSLATGNPLFPFATETLGLGHWTAEQARIWMEGHTTDLGVTDRLAAFWNQLLRFGLGPAPRPGEPWLPQWSLLPWLAIFGLALGMGETEARETGPRRSLRTVSVWLGLVLVVQLLFWLLLTHIKSRFMVPAVAPLAVAFGVGLAAAMRRARSPRMRAVLVAATSAMVLLWCCVPASIFAREQGGQPGAMLGWVDVLTGDGLSPSERERYAEAFPAVYVNYELPPGSRTLLIGDATPLYYRAPVDYQTTWDRGPLPGVMRRHPDDPEQWLAALRDLGYTHLLVNPEMLSIWEREGWGDPVLTAANVLAAADRHAALVVSFPGGGRLYGLEERAR